jgi:hypothetical protein
VPLLGRIGPHRRDAGRWALLYDLLVDRLVEESERDSKRAVGKLTEGNVQSERGDGHNGVKRDRTAKMGQSKDETQRAEEPDWQNRKGTSVVVSGACNITFTSG